MYKKSFSIFIISLLLFAQVQLIFSSEKVISPDIFLYQTTIKNKPFVYLKIIRPESVQFEIGYADKNAFNKRCSVKEIVKNYNVIAGINLSYFGYPYNKFKNGEIRGFLIENGEIKKSRSVWDLWMDTILVYTENKNFLFYRMDTTPKIILKVNGKAFTDDLSINISLAGNKKDYILFFNEYGKSYMASFPEQLLILNGKSQVSVKNPNSYIVESIIDKQQLKYHTKSCGESECHARENGHPDFRKRLDSRFRGNDKSKNCCNELKMPVIYSVKGKALLNIKQKDEIEIITDFPDEIKNSIFSVSAGNIIIKNSQYIPVSDNVNTVENKSFIGIYKTGEFLIGCALVTHSELGRTLKEMNITDSVLLDGGGSACLNVKGENIFGGDRDVANALLIRDSDDTI